MARTADRLDVSTWGAAPDRQLWVAPFSVDSAVSPAQIDASYVHDWNSVVTMPSKQFFSRLHEIIDSDWSISDLGDPMDSAVMHSLEAYEGEENRASVDQACSLLPRVPASVLESLEPEFDEDGELILSCQDDERLVTITFDGSELYHYAVTHSDVGGEAYQINGQLPVSLGVPEFVYKTLEDA